MTDATLDSSSRPARAARAARPVAVTRVTRAVWLLVLLGVVLTVLAVVLDDEIIRSTRGAAVSADDTRVPPSFTPVVVVLFVVVATLLLVLLAFVQGAHDWARHCLASTLALLAIATAAVLRTAPPVGLVPPMVVLLAVVGLVLYLLYRPGVTAYVRP